MNKCRIGLATINTDPVNFQKNIDLVIEYIKKAKQKKVDIVCFPECSLFQYAKNIPPPSDEDLLLREIKQTCQELNIWSIIPTNIMTKGIKHNRAYLINRQGEITGFYDKTHGYFDKYIGSDYPIFKTDFGKIGIVICYDLAFEESVRILVNKGAEIIFAPIYYQANEKGDQSDFVKCFPFARAFENKVFLCAVNVAKKFPYAVICSSRKKVYEYMGEEEFLLTGDLDPQIVKEDIINRLKVTLVNEETKKKYKWLRKT